MSSPASTVVLSSALSADHQSPGPAGILENTVVNHSISLGLWFTHALRFNDHNGNADVEVGYRSVMHTAIGFVVCAFPSSL
ncbi:hypothetical protein CC77DRAFT_1026101 [Alternaria alternata]|uniref:Uncharacterized protein n=1 Tax=Alternaria alternata TaxID=5599 RepID=A0A177D3K2_ALTAL|nr:hypothetical protein CC77DRAFT_1026101 [Alternaria alternata]OAG14028.1 hypothetical protein CC77DRAFT_1026101 [Alternaria alternata]